LKLLHQSDSKTDSQTACNMSDDKMRFETAHALP